MFSKKFIVWILVIVFCLGLYINKEKFECSIYKYIASRASETNDYNNAEKYYQKVINISEKSKKLSKYYFTSLNNLGTIYNKQEKYRQAESLFVRALSIPRNEVDEYYIAETSYNLGSLYMDTGRYTEAEPLFKQSLFIKRKICGINNLGYADYLENLGSLYFKQKRLNEAESLLKQSLTIRENLSGTYNKDISEILVKLGMVYLFQNKRTQAENSLGKALKICQKSNCSSLEFAGISDNLGVLYITESKYPKAEISFKQALSLYRSIGFNSKISIAEYNVAKIYMFEHKDKDALPLLEDALELSSKYLGTKSEVAIKAQKDLVLLQNHLNK